MAWHDKTKQNKTKQNKTKQNKTEMFKEVNIPALIRRRTLNTGTCIDNQEERR
jgi:hypothetical protein